jgi:hypothetical protein
MKSFQTYLAELNRVYEFRVKIAGVNLDKEVMDRVKHALETYQVESVGAPKRMPIQEHAEFMKLGACECSMFEVALRYPVTVDQLRQVISERARLNAEWVCVKTKNQMDFNEEFEAQGKDQEGALLTDDELKADKSGQELAGTNRVSSLIKELESRKYEFAEKSKEKGHTLNDEPQGNTSPVGTKQNKIPSPAKGQ